MTVIKQQAEVTVTDYTDADHLTTWYRLTTSPTLPSAPSWATDAAAISGEGSTAADGWCRTEPGFSTSSGTPYLYECMQTVWGDGTCEWSSVQLSSSYEAAKAAYNEAQAAKQIATNYIFKTTGHDAWVCDENAGPNPSTGEAYGPSDANPTTGWRLGSVFELVKQGVSWFKLWVENNVAKLRLGRSDQGHLILDSDSVDLIADDGVSAATFGETSRVGKPRVANSMVTYIGKDEGGNRGLFEIVRWAGADSCYSYFKAVHDKKRNTDYVIIGSGSGTFPGYGIGAVALGDFARQGTGPTGQYAIAEGYNCTASGPQSHAQNYDTIAASSHQTALGKYNVEDANGTYAVIVGNGTGNSSIARRNAATIDWLGCAGLWHPEIIRGTAPSSDIYGGGGALKLVDKNGVQIGFVQPVQLANGTEAIQLGVGNSDSSDWNTLAIGYDSNDNKYVSISGRSEWRNALGASSGIWPVSVGGTGTADFATIASDHAGSNVKVPTSTYKSIASVQLAAGGTYILIGGVSFASNATGRRFTAMYTSETTPSDAYIRATGVTVTAVNGAQTRLHTSWIAAPPSNTTMHLLGWQNSGGDLNATGYLRAIRIA